MTHERDNPVRFVACHERPLVLSQQRTDATNMSPGALNKVPRPRPLDPKNLRHPLDDTFIRYPARISGGDQPAKSVPRGNFPQTNNFIPGIDYIWAPESRSHPESTMTVTLQFVGRLCHD